MPVIVIANPKGGVGKSTISTHVAGFWANQGHAVMLGDIDRQQSSRLWLQLRHNNHPQLPRINAWEIDGEYIAKAPKGTTHMVLDTPASLHGKRLDTAIKLADMILIPLQASVFDIYATRDFIAELQTNKRADGVKMAVVANRVKDHTKASDHLQSFLSTLKVPVLTQLRDTQNYAHLAAHGLTLFDVAATRVEKDLAQWELITQWLNKT